MLQGLRPFPSLFLLACLVPALQAQDPSQTSAEPSWETLLAATAEMAQPLVDDGLTVGM